MYVCVLGWQQTYYTLMYLLITLTKVKEFTNSNWNKVDGGFLK